MSGCHKEARLLVSRAHVMITCYGDTGFRIKDSQLFYVVFLAPSNSLSLDELWRRLELELQNVIVPIFYLYTTEDLYCNPEVKRICFEAID